MEIKRIKKNFYLFTVLFMGICFSLQARQGQMNVGQTDIIDLGNEASTASHHVELFNAEYFKAALSKKAVHLLPLPKPQWMGGKISFSLKVDADKQNYITVKLWGSDISTNRLYLVVDGKQIGYRHLGDIDILDNGSEQPFYNDRFFYNTSPLPLAFTRGKKELKVEIRSQGNIWGYGQTWDKYQKDMTSASRGIYNIYSHTTTDLPISAMEIQGAYVLGTKRPTPGPEVIDAVKGRVNKEIQNLLQQTKPLSQMQMQFLAKAFHVKWSAGYQNRKLIGKVLNGLDAIYLAYLNNPRLAEAEPSTWNPEWFGLGPSGQIIFLMRDAFADSLDRSIRLPNSQSLQRRKAFSDMLFACRDWHQKNRRLYTNQSMINDLYGIYYANKGLKSLNSDAVLEESKVRRYLYESIGIQPWLGSDLKNGSPSLSAGTNYMQLTAKGLTKELGFVGNYGEVLDWVSEIYEATIENGTGDEKIKMQLIKIAKARAPFRYPMLDDKGYRSMRSETYVGWRDTHYPGDVTYAQRPSWDGSPLQAAVITTDKNLLGYAQQMLVDNQFFSVIEEGMKDKGFRTTSGMLQVPDQYDALKKYPQMGIQLPMSWEEPNYIFSDEEDGVVAVKNGTEILYVSLYWRARFGINNLARIHLISPTMNNIATVFIKEEFQPSGMYYQRPNWTNFGFGNGGIKYPDSLSSAHYGEKLPIAKIPDGAKYHQGSESPYAGRADYYELNYGNYIIAMNSSSGKTFMLQLPEDFLNAKNLGTGKTVGKAKSIEIPPMKTVVIYKGVGAVGKAK